MENLSSENRFPTFHLAFYYYFFGTPNLEQCNTGTFYVEFQMLIVEVKLLQ